MTKICGKSVATAEQMAAYLLSVNSTPKISMDVKDFCQLFLDTAEKEGVRGDALFAQSCKETGNFAFRGTVKPEQNNFAGLGTTDPNTPGASFPDAATGILAQAQHAKAYATKKPLSSPFIIKFMAHKSSNCDCDRFIPIYLYPSMLVSIFDISLFPLNEKDGRI